MQQVKKRDGRSVGFSSEFITIAISKALDEVGINDPEFPNHATSAVVRKLSSLGIDEVPIETIQRVVEDVLMRSRYPDVARAYIQYRHDRDVSRDSRSDLSQKIMGLMNRTDRKILSENANKDSAIISTQRDLLAGVVSKYFSKYYLPREVLDAHKEGLLHFHDLDYSPFFPSFNCFSRETSFVTKNGIKSFNDFADGDVVYVPSHTGVIRKAIVRNYGVQPLNKITFKRGRGYREVYATGTHRWLTTKGETTNLKVGDSIINAPDMKIGDYELIPWCLGFCYGDGSMTSDGALIVRLCGQKIRFADVFTRAGFNVTYPPSLKGDALVRLPKYKKSLPTDGVDVRSFVLGYASADASRNLQNIQATGDESVNFIREHFDTAGLYIGAEQDFTDHDTSYGKRGGTTVMFNITKPTHLRWNVVDIQQSVRTEDVWCLEVEEDHSFILRGGIVTGNCMLVDAGGMFKSGFVIGNAHIETPRSIGTAATVLTQIIAHVASQIYGGNTINRIDEVLAPYVTMSYEKLIEEGEWLGLTDPKIYADKKIRKEVYDAVQCLEYQVNSLFSSNGQTPFCTFGFGLGDTWEAVLIQEMILRVRIGGLGRHHITPVFPKLVFALKRGHNLNEGDPFYHIKQLALECAAKRMYPDIVSYDKVVEVTGSFKFPMGCRSFLSRWVDENGVEQHEGRNNLGVVTLNLPRVALDAGGDQIRFFELLEERMELVKTALLSRIDRLRGVTASVAPILYVHGACGVRLNPDDEVMKIFENGRATVSFGYIGLNEVTEILNFANDDHVMDNKEKTLFLHQMMQIMKERVSEWTAETGFGFSLYGTPSESLCYRFHTLDCEKYGDQYPVLTEKDYYTNSFHLDVRHKTNPYDKIDFEAQFVPYSSGGFICYGEYPNMRHNLKALEDVWDYAYERIPYYGTNTPTDQCFDCGFEGEFNATSKGYECPRCGCHEKGRVSVIRRVCGYLGAPDSRPFNVGKQDEVIRRVKHL